jgi:DNA-binding response OmpR family regulator
MSTIKVALIEDDLAIVQMYTMALKLKANFEVKVANDGAEGLELIKSFDPDIILLDMMMPHMSGVEALTRLRKLPHGDKYKVIALTNMKDADTVAKINQLKVSDYLVKAEQSPASLIKRIQEILDAHATPAKH